MKIKYFLLLIPVLLFGGCDDHDSALSDLAGKWVLKEMLVDPGDGSGDFHEVFSYKTISFSGNGTYSVNGTLCDMSTDAGDETQGVFNDIEKTITPADCGMILSFEANEKELIITYPCIEPCKMKYRRVLFL